MSIITDPSQIINAIRDGEPSDPQHFIDVVETAVDSQQRASKAETAATNSANSASQAAATAPTAATNAVNEKLSTFQQQVTSAETAANNSATSALAAQQAAEQAAETGGTVVSVDGITQPTLSFIGGNPQTQIDNLKASATRTALGLTKVTSPDGIGTTSIGTSSTLHDIALSFNMQGSSGNFNDYRTPGEWYFYITPTTTVPNASYPNTVTNNYPLFKDGTSQGMYLKVTMGYSNTYCQQMCWRRGSSEVWIRNSTSATTWSDWSPMGAITIDLGTSGGTLERKLYQTGNMKIWTSKANLTSVSAVISFGITFTTIPVIQIASFSSTSQGAISNLTTTGFTIQPTGAATYHFIAIGI